MKVLLFSLVLYWCGAAYSTGYVHQGRQEYDQDSSSLDEGGEPKFSQSQPGPYGFYAGSNLGSTQSERMLWAAASPTNQKVNCKNCSENDLFCLSKCAVHVVRAKVLASKRAKARVEILCSLKYPSLEKALTSNKTATSLASKSSSLPGSKVTRAHDNVSTTTKKHKKKASWFENLLEGLKGTFGIRAKRKHKPIKNVTIPAPASKNSSSDWMDDLFSSFDDKDWQNDESYQGGEDDLDWTAVDDAFYENKGDDDVFDDVFADLFKKEKKAKSAKLALGESELQKEKPKQHHHQQAPFFSGHTFFGRLLQNIGLARVGQAHGKIVSIFSQTTIGPDGKPVSKKVETVRVLKQHGDMKKETVKDAAKVITIKYGSRSGCSLKKGDTVFLFLGKGKQSTFVVHGSRKSTCPGIVGKGQSPADAARTAQSILKTVEKKAVGSSCPIFSVE